MEPKTITGIMQPYFLPYIGYWQLINAVDVFVVYDNIQYTKKGWFNRNRFLQNGQDALFSIPLKNDSDYLDVNQRFISFEYNKKKLIAQFQNAYNKAPYVKEVMPLIEKIIMFNDDNLFNYTFNSIKEICNYFDINTKIIISSSIDIDHSLKGSEKVKAICKALNADIYINTVGGVSLYDKEDFSQNELELKFIKPNDIQYKQFNDDFVPWLSIIDILMFNCKEEIHKMIMEYELL